MRVLGLDGPLLENALAFLSIDDLTASEVSGDDLEGAETMVRRAHRRSSAQLANALQPFGYYEPTIEATLSDGPPWQATYRIDKGSRVRVDAVELSVSGQGASLESLIAVFNRIRAMKDRVLDHGVYSSLKAEAVSVAISAGYLDAGFTTATLKIVPSEQRATATLVFDTGDRWYFGSVQIVQDVLRDSFVSRYHQIEPGQPFDAQRLVNLQLALTDSGYFDDVELNVQRDEAVDQNIPVTVTVQPSKRQRYSAGAGFGTDTGARVKAGLETRRVNRRGHRYRFDARASSVSSALRAEYRIPFKNISEDAWRIHGRIERSEIGDADAAQYLLGVAREDSWGRLRRRLFANVERENFEFGDQPSQASTLVYPGISVSMGSLDSARFVRRGYSINMTLQAGADALGSDVDFVSARLSARAVLGLGPRSRFLAGLDLGHVASSEFDDLPPSQRFFAGGDRSVRGYRFEGISPVNEDGDDIGGDTLASISLEADVFFKDNWGVAVFADRGSSSRGASFDWKDGVGIGLRYRSPVGMIRFDLAHPLDDPDTDFRIHLSIGPDL